MKGPSLCFSYVPVKTREEPGGTGKAQAGCGGPGLGPGCGGPGLGPGGLWGPWAGQSVWAGVRGLQGPVTGLLYFETQSKGLGSVALELLSHISRDTHRLPGRLPKRRNYRSAGNVRILHSPAHHSVWWGAECCQVMHLQKASNTARVYTT